MAIAPSSAVGDFVDAIVTRDLARARDQLHEEIDFRAMTPNRIWEADGTGDVEATLRHWLADPDEEIHAIEPTEPVAVEDTLRVGWRVHGTDEDGPFVFEQQAYVREHDGRIAWLRVFCSGYRRPA
jgi:ketosteroid isomerase-like protein